MGITDAEVKLVKSVLLYAFVKCCFNEPKFNTEDNYKYCLYSALDGCFV